MLPTSLDWCAYLVNISLRNYNPESLEADLLRYHHRCLNTVLQSYQITADVQIMQERKDVDYGWRVQYFSITTYL